MQAIDQQPAAAASTRFVRVMATFGMIVASTLVAATLVIGGVLLVGAIAPRAATTVSGDPLAAPAVVQFRNSEHSAPIAASNEDLLAASGLAAFRASEHSSAELPWTGDPLSQPSLVEFRNGEHAEAR